MTRLEAAAFVEALEAWMDTRYSWAECDPITSGAGEIKAAALAEHAMRERLIDRLSDEPATQPTPRPL